jgi:hypothetical protein
MHVCMYACMHVCMYACMHARVYDVLCVHTHTKTKSQTNKQRARQARVGQPQSVLVKRPQSAQSKQSAEERPLGKNSAHGAPHVRYLHLCVHVCVICSVCRAVRVPCLYLYLRVCVRV